MLLQGVLQAVVLQIVAFGVGYVTESFAMTVYIWAGASVFGGLVSLFDWPCYKRHPIQFLESLPKEDWPKGWEGPKEEKQD